MAKKHFNYFYSLFFTSDPDLNQDTASLRCCLYKCSLHYSLPFLSKRVKRVGVGRSCREIPLCQVFLCQVLPSPTPRERKAWYSGKENQNLDLWAYYSFNKRHLCPRYWTGTSSQLRLHWVFSNTNDIYLFLMRFPHGFSTRASIAC